MMSLNEAIKHAEEVAEENEKTEKEWEKAVSGNQIGWSKSDIHNVENAISNCGKCAAEHRQLAAWLRELQERRKAPEIVYCGACIHFQCNMRFDGSVPKGADAYECRHWCGGCDPMDYCSYGKRREGRTE